MDYRCNFTSQLTLNSCVHPCWLNHSIFSLHMMIWWNPCSSPCHLDKSVDSLSTYPCRWKQEASRNSKLIWLWTWNFLYNKDILKNSATLMRLLPCKNWSDLFFFFFLLIPGRYLMGITEFCFWCEAFQKMECPHLCPMRFLHTELQHFILRFIKMCLLYGYHWNCGDRGVKGGATTGWRHGYFTDNSIQLKN